MSELVVLRPRGFINRHEADAFIAKMDRLVTDETRILVIDCGELDYINSRVVGEILRVFTTLASRGGGVRLAAAGESLQKVFRLVGLLDLVRCYDTVEAATAEDADPTAAE